MCSKLAVVDQARTSYEEALGKAAVHLRAGHPTLLGLACNYSIFLHELVRDTQKACDIVRTAFEDAIADSDVSEDDYKKSVPIAQSIRDNLVTWTNE